MIEREYPYHCSSRTSSMVVESWWAGKHTTFWALTTESGNLSSPKNSNLLNRFSALASACPHRKVGTHVSKRGTRAKHDIWRLGQPGKLGAVINGAKRSGVNRGHSRILWGTRSFLRSSEAIRCSRATPVMKCFCNNFHSWSESLADHRRLL